MRRRGRRPLRKDATDHTDYTDYTDRSVLAGRAQSTTEGAAARCVRCAARRAAGGRTRTRIRAVLPGVRLVVAYARDPRRPALISRPVAADAAPAVCWRPLRLCALA